MYFHKDHLVKIHISLYTCTLQTSVFIISEKAVATALDHIISIYKARSQFAKCVQSDDIPVLASADR